MPTPEDFINITGVPVPGVATPGFMLPPAQPVIGAPQLDVPDYSRGAPPPPAAPAAPAPQWQPSGAGSLIVPEGGDVAPAAPVAPSAQQPTQFVSRPQAKPMDAAALLAPVGSISTGTQTSVSKTDLGKAGQDAAKAREEADAASTKAIGLGVNAAQERAAFEAEAAKARVDAAAKFDAELQQKRAADVQMGREHAADIQRRIGDVEKEAANISGDRWWQDQSTGAKIGGLLSIALSGLGQVFSAKGGNVNARNSALDMINMAVDRDIDAQKTRLAAKERGIRTRESAYSAARQAGADDIAATEAAKAANYGQIERQLQAKIAGLGDKDAVARGQALLADVQAKRAEHLQRVAEATATRVQSTSGSRPVTGLEVAQLQGQMQAAQQESFRQEHGLVKKDPLLQTPVGQAPDKETARDLREKVTSLEGAERSVQAIRSILKGGGDRLDPQKRKALGFARTQLAQYIKSPAGANLGAALSDSEKALFLDEMLPDADFFQQLSGRTDTTLKLLDRQFRDTRESWKKAYTVRTE